LVRLRVSRALRWLTLRLRWGLTPKGSDPGLGVPLLWCALNWASAVVTPAAPSRR